MSKFNITSIEKLISNKCWKLSSCLIAEYDFKKLQHPDGEWFCVFGNDFKDLFEENFYRELLELSILVRSAIDMRNLDIEKDVTVGLLKKGKEKEIELTLRNACNKIIHMESYDIHYNISDLHPLKNKIESYNQLDVRDYKNPLIKIYGEYQSQKWSVTLSFFEFIQASMNINFLNRS